MGMGCHLQITGGQILTHLETLIRRFSARWWIQMDVIAGDWIIIRAIDDRTGQVVSATMQTIEDTAQSLTEMLEQNEKSLEKGCLKLAGPNR